MVILLVFQAIIALALIGVILLQKSEGGGLAGMGGGGGGPGNVFTSRGASNFLTRTTAVLAAIFMINCLGMSIVGGKMTRSESRLLSGDAPIAASNVVDVVDEGNDKPAS